MKKISKVHLILGTQEFLLKEKTEQIISLFREGEDTEIEKYLCRDLTGKDSISVEMIGRVINSLNSPNLFTDQKIIVLEQIELLPKNSNAQAKDSVSALLETIVEKTDNPPENVLILTAKVKNLKELSRSLAEKAKGTQGMEVHKTPVTYDDFNASQYILEYAKQSGIRLTSQTVALIADICGNDLQIIKNELVKVSVYLNDRNTPINEEELKKILSNSKDSGVFRVPEFLVAKNMIRTMEVFDELMYKRNDALISILSILNHQFRILLKTARMLELHYSESEIRNNLKLAPFLVKRKISEAGNFKVRELENILIEMYRLDARIKLSGKKNGPRILKDFLFKVISGVFLHRFAFSKSEF